MYEALLEFTGYVSQVGFFLWTWVFGVALMVGGVYFTFKTGFVQLNTVKDALRLIMGKDSATNEAVSDDSKPTTRLSAFQAFCISESSRVGTGNITGTALAIVIGGPGALFWMWAMAFFGACTSFVESTLGQLFKENHGDRFMGGSMYYFKRAYKSKWPSKIFAAIVVIQYVFVFNSIQINTIADTFVDFVPNRIFVGIIISAFTLIVIFGGLKRIAQAATTLLPFMVITFLVVSYGIILFNIPQFLQSMGVIVQSAFGVEQVAGGAVGFTIGNAMQQGFRRGLFSNEAGLGTVPIGASTSNVSHPAKQGLVSCFGVYVDTMLIASATGFFVIMSGAYLEGITGVALVRAGFVYFMGPASEPFLLVMLLLLPITSILGNYFYGETSLRYLTDSKKVLYGLRVAAGILLVLASLAPLQLVWNLNDISTGTLMTLNIIVLFKLGKLAFAVLDDYRKQLAAFRAGTGPEPIFYDDTIGIDTPYWKRDR